MQDDIDATGMILGMHVVADSITLSVEWQRLVINRIGDDVKAVVDSFESEWYALASKKPKAAATSSSKTGFYAGLGFGMVGALAVAGVVSAVNKKQQVKDNEETLL